MKLTFLIVLIGVYACSAQDSSTTPSPSYTDRRCGEDLGNLWLDVVAVVDNSIGMTNGGLTSIAANIASVVSSGTRIGTNPSEPRTTRLGLVTYNKAAAIQADLNQYQSLDDVYDNVFRALSSVSTSEESYLANGLARAEDVLEAGKQGYNRTHYQRVVIVYASAYKGSGALDPVPVAERLKTSGVTVITVAYDQDGDGALLADLAKIASPPYNFTNTEDNGQVIGEIQDALLQVNCFCRNSWIQYRVSYTDVHSYRYGVCILPVGFNAVWRAAKSSCMNRNAYLVTEFDSNKHDYVLTAVSNYTGFSVPLTYHNGLSMVKGVWVWDQPQGMPQPQLQSYAGWNPGYPISDSTLTGVLNQQSSVQLQSGWQNIKPLTTGANYVCETASCDTDNYCTEAGLAEISVKH